MTIIADAVFAAFDCETTGLGLVELQFPSSNSTECSNFRNPSYTPPLPIKTTNRIVEIAVVLFNHKGDILERYNSLVNPQRPMPLEAIAIHGISDGDVESQPTAPIVIPHLKELLKRADMITGFKTWFDLRYLIHECLIAGMDPPDFTVYDASRIAYRAGFGQVGLVECAEYLGIPVSGAHRALIDSELTSKVWLKFLEQAFDPSDNLDEIRKMHDMSNPAYNTRKALKSVQDSYKSAEDRVNKFRDRTEKKMHTVCITGKLPGFARKHFKARLEGIGYRYVQEARDYVELMVVGQKPTPRKLKDATAHGLTTISGERFVKWLEAKEKALTDQSTGR